MCNSTLCLNENYSTTKLVTNDKPQIVNNPDEKFESLLFLPFVEGRKGEGGLRTKGYFKKSYENKPLITVVTVVYNGEKHLEETILSVLNQTYDNVEYIIIDGGSTDGTLDIIKKYENYIDYWVSEKDGGIYDAMNKGIILATGTLIGFVNADDYLYSNALHMISTGYCLQPFDYSVGPVDKINAEGKKIEVMKVLTDFYRDQNYLFDMPTSHQAFYISVALLKKIGKFDTQFKLRADYDLVIRAMKETNNYYELKSSISAFREGGVSGSYSTFLENFKLYKKHGVNRVVAIRLTIVSLIKVFVSRNFPRIVVRVLRKTFSSGRFERVS
jgi:glycosyltransferase involved in cell wall biosynthesis